MLYMVAFTINIPQMSAYIPYMDPMGYGHVFSIFLGKKTGSDSTQSEVTEPSWQKHIFRRC